MRVAVCDPEAFSPFRALVEGPITNAGQLARAERFVRTVLLHDDMVMDPAPWPYDPESEREWTEEERAAGGRNVIVAIRPVLDGYSFISGHPAGDTSVVSLEPELVSAARRFSNATEGNVYFDAHIEFLQRIVSILQSGGSALLGSEFGRSVIETSSRYPAELFDNLDAEWQAFARESEAGAVGVTVPPVLSIVLTRCARRSAIPDVLEGLRYEWKSARTKMWALLDQLKTAETVGTAHEIRRELEEASAMFSPTKSELDTRPVRVLWDLVGGALSGGAIGAISGGHPILGAATGAVKAVTSAVSLLGEFGPALFGRGAFDLARRVRTDLRRVEYNSLARLLSDQEKQQLGM